MNATRTATGYAITIDGETRGWNGKRPLAATHVALAGKGFDHSASTSAKNAEKNVRSYGYRGEVIILEIV